MKHFLFLLVALCAASFSFSQQAGTLDNTFNGTGKVITSFDSSAYGMDVRIVTGGKILVGGRKVTGSVTSGEPLLIRYNQDGSIDSTFGINGKMVYSLFNGGLRFESMLVQNDGKILLSGPSNVGFIRAYVLRLNANGTVDSSFATNGCFLSDGITTTIEMVHLLSDGKLLLSTSYEDSVPVYAAIRLLPNGIIDSTYGTNGKSRVPYPSNFSYITLEASCVNAQNELFVASSSPSGSNNALFFKIDANGILDATFGNGGMSLQPTIKTMGLAVQPDGKIVATGTPYSPIKRMAMRLNPNGSLDTTFNHIGYRVYANIFQHENFFAKPFITPDNRIFTGFMGYANNYAEYFGAALINSNGTPNTNFGTNGLFWSDFPTRNETVRAIDYDPTTGVAILTGEGIDTTQNNKIVLLVARIHVPAIPCTPTQIFQNISLCAGSSYSFNGLSITQAGTYVDTLQTIDGCDSIISLNITVLPLLIQTQNIMLCQGEEVIINGISYSQNATIIDTIHANIGCDTVKTYYINVIPASDIDTFNFQICIGDTLFYNGNTYTVAGVYQDTLTSVNGCDSIERITLTLAPPPQALFSIIPSQYAPHTWYALNQSTGNTPLTYTWYWGDGTSDTGSAASHTYTSEGYYNICLEATTDMGCTDTYCDSSTYIFKAESTITINVVEAIPTSIHEATKGLELSIIPNPTNGLVNISADASIASYTLTDNLGRILYSKTINGTLNEQLDLSNYSNGVYLLRLSDNKGNSITKRALKQ